MNEKAFEEFISKIDTDISYDQRITEHLLNNKELNDNYNQRNRLYHIGNKIKHDLRLTKVAAIIILFVLIGTSTTLATNYLKSYPAEVKVIPESDQYSGEVFYPSNKLTFGKGHKVGTQVGFDKDGNISEIKISSGKRFLSAKDIKAFQKEDKEYGDEAFAYMGLPNLFPTLLYEDYILYYGGYQYSDYSEYDELEPWPHISAEFKSINSDKAVSLSFYLSKSSTKDLGVNLAHYFNLLNTETYTNQGGLICTIYQYEGIQNRVLGSIVKETNLSAYIIYDSATHGNGNYHINFNNIDLDDAKAILDSIPIQASEE